MTELYKKITPKGDLTWYIKWSASAILLVAVMCRSVPEVPKIYDVVLSFVGCGGWFVVGMMWNDRALVVLNAVLCLVLGTSIIQYIA